MPFAFDMNGSPVHGNDALGGKLVIQIEHDQEKAQIIVKDIGEGIPQEMMESIFQPFVTSKEKGTGLGLVVCKRIISMYGGPSFLVECLLRYPSQ